MNKQLIKQLREAWEKTSGRWHINEYGHIVDSKNFLIEKDSANFIVLAHNHLPELLDALEEAQRKAEAGERVVEALKEVDVYELFDVGDNSWWYQNKFSDFCEQVTNEYDEVIKK